MDKSVIVNFNDNIIAKWFIANSKYPPSIILPRNNKQSFNLRVPAKQITDTDNGIGSSAENGRDGNGANNVGSSSGNSVGGNCINSDAEVGASGLLEKGLVI